ncbi:ribosome recycling factor [Candidatus Falkowbacteria bacterium]|nr:ribosome recycling factor [Candidatus Falkowbacteria bacterium]
MARNLYIDKFKTDFDNALAHAKSDVAGIRTGRANTKILEDVMVEAYGALQPIKNLANLSIPENTAIGIDPWDKSLMKAIEKAIIDANLGLAVVNTGAKLLAKVPLLTEETRKDMVKLLGRKIEDARISVRKLRDTVKDAITSAEKSKEITEDDKFAYLAGLDEFIDEQNEILEKMRDDKEKELMTI